MRHSIIPLNTNEISAISGGNDVAPCVIGSIGGTIVGLFLTSAMVSNPRNFLTHDGEVTLSRKCAITTIASTTVGCLAGLIYSKSLL